MLITLDREMAELTTALKWEDWKQVYVIAVQHPGTAHRRVRVVPECDEGAYRAIPGVQIHHWTIWELYADLLIGVAYGFKMTELTDTHCYCLATLIAIHKYTQHADSADWTPYPPLL